MSEENKNLFVELPEGATEKDQKDWQRIVNNWSKCDEPYVIRAGDLDNAQKANAYCNGVETCAKAMAICGGIYWGISKLLKHLNKKKIKDKYGRYYD